jgi:hypothetical protein
MYQKAVKFIQLFMFLNFSDQRIQLPEWVLDSKLIRRGKRSVHCVLVKWISLPDNMATREDVNTSATNTLVLPEETATTGEQAQPVRKRRPNVRITGQEWEA